MDDASMVSYHNDHGTLEVRHRHEVIRVQAWGADNVRVRSAQHRIPARHDGGATAQVPLSPGGIPVFAREEAEVLDVVR